MTDPIEKSRIYFRLGKLDRAAAVWLEELQENPGNALAHCQLAFIQIAMGHLDLALQSVQEGVRLRPDWDYTYFALAQCLIAMDQWNPAQKAINEALKLNPVYPFSIVLSARIAVHDKKWLEASGLLDRALEMDPNHLETRNLKTYVLANSGKKAQAHSFNEETLKHHPEDGFAQMMMGFKLWEMGKGKEAEARLDEALRLEPQSDSFRRSKIRFLKAQRRFISWLGHFSVQKNNEDTIVHCIILFIICFLYIFSFDLLKDVLKNNNFFVPFVWFFVFIYFMFWIGDPLSDFFLAFTQKRLYYPGELLLSRWCAGLLALSMLGIPLLLILSRDWLVLGGFAFLLPLLTLFPVMGFLTLSPTKKRWIIYPLTALMAMLFLAGGALMIWAVGVSPKVSLGLQSSEIDARIWGIGLWEMIPFVAIPMGYLVKKDG